MPEPATLEGDRGPAPIAFEAGSPIDLSRRIAQLEARAALSQDATERLLEAERERSAELERTRAQMLAYAGDLRWAFRAERARRAELERTYVATVRVLACAIETRDPYTGGHVDRVATYATAIGRELGWTGSALHALEVGALLHDIGKIGVADAILRKPGPLDAAEWQLMRQHPTIGAGLVGGLAALQPSLAAILHHHERYDGQGYPSGLAGADIPPVARAVAVADAFDAMVTDRPYRAGLSPEAAAEELERCAGTQFDPEYAAAFVALLRGGRLSALGASGGPWIMDRGA